MVSKRSASYQKNSINGVLRGFFVLLLPDLQYLSNALKDSAFLQETIRLEIAQLFSANIFTVRFL